MGDMNMYEAYREFTIRRKTDFGYMVKCKKGLWRVDARTKEAAEREARHYFMLYFNGGEYT